MTEIIKFIPKHQKNSLFNLKDFIESAKQSTPPLGIESNFFDSQAWSVKNLGPKGESQRYIYFVQRTFDTRKNRLQHGKASIVPAEFLLRKPFLDFAKALTMYLHSRNPTKSLSIRIIAFRYFEEALFELTGNTCPTKVTPEVMFRAQNLALASRGLHSAYSVSLNLNLIFNAMLELRLIAIPSQWKSSIRSPVQRRVRVGKQFDDERQRRLPSPLALKALAEIFSSTSDDPTEIFTSSLCALMLCAPDRAVEALFAPLKIITEDWCDPETGEFGTGLRWFPVKGGAPLIKTVIPSMRKIAIKAVERLKVLSNPARELACWYEKNPTSLFLKKDLEHLRSKERISNEEIQAIVFGNNSNNGKISASNRLMAWLDKNNIPRQSNHFGTTVSFKDLEKAIISKLPPGFPILDTETGLRYSEALCIARVSEFNSRAITPSACSFRHVRYGTLKNSLKSNGINKSIFEKRGYVDSAGVYLSLSSHMLRHYLNTLVRQSGFLTEADIASWSGRMSVHQNSSYNHMSDRDVLAKLRGAVGDPSLSLGPFSNMDKRIFIARDHFAAVKVITAHTSEFGHCIHDYSQSPCQVFSDCINCSEQVCIKGDLRAAENLRKIHLETVALQEQAKIAFSAETLGAAEWYLHQTKTLNRICELIRILDDPFVPDGSVIQLSAIQSASQLEMIDRARQVETAKIIAVPKVISKENQASLKIGKEPR